MKQRLEEEEVGGGGGLFARQDSVAVCQWVREKKKKMINQQKTTDSYTILRAYLSISTYHAGLCCQKIKNSIREAGATMVNIGNRLER